MNRKRYISIIILGMLIITAFGWKHIVNAYDTFANITFKKSIPTYNCGGLFFTPEDCDKLKTQQDSYNNCLADIYELKQHLSSGRCTPRIRITAKFTTQKLGTDTCYIEFDKFEKQKYVVSGRPDCVRKIKQVYKNELFGYTEDVTTSVSPGPKLQLRESQTDSYFCGIYGIMPKQNCDSLSRDSRVYEMCMNDNDRYIQTRCKPVIRITTPNYNFNKCHAKYSSKSNYDSMFSSGRFYTILDFSNSPECTDFIESVKQKLHLYD